MRKLIAVGSLLLIGAAPPPSPDARLRAIIAPVSQVQLRHTIEALGQLRHAAHLVVADRSEARDRGSARLGQRASSRSFARVAIA